MLCSPSRFVAETNAVGLEVDAVHRFGHDYLETLKRWLAAFDGNVDAIRAQGFDDHFILCWRFYLAYCAASFPSETTDVARIDEIYAAEAYFRDPFSEVRGADAIERIYARMFEQFDDCRFVITDTLAEGRSALQVWDFSFRIRRWRPRTVQTIHGATHLAFATDGRIAYRRDYWDPAEELYAKLPPIGPVLRGLRKFVA
jgi:steroid Delta-isomerase